MVDKITNYREQAMKGIAFPGVIASKPATLRLYRPAEAM